GASATVAAAGRAVPPAADGVTGGVGSSDCIRSASMGKIRLYIDHGFAPGQPVPLDAAQAHYLGGVMRQPVGAEIAVFNGRDGEWSARLQSLGKRGAELGLIAPTAPQVDPPDVWLLFAPIKKARTDFIVEKAAELGAARIQPVQTDHSNTER